jgi:hypothetical protein
VLIGISSAHGQNRDAKDAFADNLKRSALQGADNTIEKLNRRAAIGKQTAAAVKAGIPLSAQQRNDLSNSFGQSAVAAIATKPKSAAKVLETTSKNAAADATRLLQLRSQLDNAKPAAAISGLSEFSRYTTQIGVFQGEPSSPKQIEIGVFPSKPSQGNTSKDKLGPPTPGLSPRAASGSSASDVPTEASLAPRIGIFPGDRGGPTTQYESVGLLLSFQQSRNRFDPACTGTLVRSDKVVTAAHCFCLPVGDETITADQCQLNARESLDRSRWRVFFQYAGIFEISKIEINPNYKFGNSGTEADVAVVSLTAPINGMPVYDLPSPQSNLPADNIRVLGFGYSFAPNTPGLPSAQEIPADPGLMLWAVVKLTDCKPPFDSANNLCWTSGAVGPAPAGAICGGDSGGPLLQGDPPALFGINSGAVGSCQGESPSGDTKLVAPANARFLQQSLGPPSSLSPTRLTTFFSQSLQLLDETGAWNSSLLVDAAVDRLVISVNGEAKSNLMLQALDDARTPICTKEGGPPSFPGVTVCQIFKPRLGSTFRIIVNGAASRPFQIVASGTLGL